MSYTFTTGASVYVDVFRPCIYMYTYVYVSTYIPTHQNVVASLVVRDRRALPLNVATPQSASAYRTLFVVSVFSLCTRLSRQRP